MAFSSAYHPQSNGQSERTIQTLEDMLRACCLEWQGAWTAHLPLVEFAYNNSYHSSIGLAPYEALYGRPCRTPLDWFEVGERVVTGPELVQQSVEVVQLVRQRLQSAQSRQKSYADQRRRPLEFQVGDQVFVRVSPMKGVVRFGKRGKLSPRFIGPFTISERVGGLAYRLELPSELAAVHDVFHVSMLRRYLSDESHVLQSAEWSEVTPVLTVPEFPLHIEDRRVQRLRNKAIPLVRVAWQRHSGGESTWEREDEMREQFPYLYGESSFFMLFEF